MHTVHWTDHRSWSEYLRTNCFTFVAWSNLWFPTKYSATYILHPIFQIKYLSICEQTGPHLSAHQIFAAFRDCCKRGFVDGGLFTTSLWILQTPSSLLPELRQIQHAFESQPVRFPSCSIFVKKPCNLMLFQVPFDFKEFIDWIWITSWPKMEMECIKGLFINYNM